MKDDDIVINSNRLHSRIEAEQPSEILVEKSESDF